jgi:AmmeMemoRadiSam system protein A
MSSLRSSDKQTLLEIARQAVVRAVAGGKGPADVPIGEPPTEPTACAGAFVTLRTRGRLRGCIGQISSDLPLAEMVAYCAKAAALEDPRFAPMRTEDLGAMDIEISVLTPPEEILPEAIQAGKHGLIVSRGRQRGVLLPHVATEFGWPALRFLEETCLKAGLERDAWKNPETKIQAFTAEVFTEREFGATDSRGGARSRPATGYSSST